jgi:hypothetical protein
MVDIVDLVYFTLLLFVALFAGWRAIWNRRSVPLCITTATALTLLTPYIQIMWFKLVVMFMVLVYLKIGYQEVVRREEEEKVEQLAQIRPRRVEY